MKISPRELREAQIPSKAFGFNQDVVDALLERAADTIEGLIEENRQLFEALERLRSEGAAAVVADPFAEVAPVSAPEPEPIPEPVAVAPAAPVDEAGSVHLAEKEELINKTLLLAQKTADETLKTAKSQAEELVATAQTQADELVATAKAEAEMLSGAAKEEAETKVAQAQEAAQSLVAQAQSEADSLVATAQAQADSIHEEERTKFVALVEQLTQERAQLVSDIEILQGFDQEHRARLKDAVQEDLAKLQARETIDVASLPDLPKVQDIAPAPAPQVVAPAEPLQEITSEPEIVAQAQVEPATFDDVFDATLDEDAAIDAIELDDDVISDDFEVDEIVEVAAAGDEPMTPEEAYSHDDPFAAFVDAPSVVEPAGNNDSTQVVEPTQGRVESSDSSGAFEPSRNRSESRKEEMDDDDFFASLREAVQDDKPLGPSDDDSEGEGRFKGLFKK